MVRFPRSRLTLPLLYVFALPVRMSDHSGNRIKSNNLPDLESRALRPGEKLILTIVVRLQLTLRSSHCAC